jgi:L-rhamnose mutarotase
MRRYGMVLKVRPERLQEYKDLHVNVWPEVLKLYGQPLASQ